MYVKDFIKSLLPIICHFLVIIYLTPAQAQNDCMPDIRFQHDSNYSANYNEVMSFYHNAGRCADFVRFSSFGESDSGKPLSVFIVDKKSQFEPLSEDDNRAVILINNGIHPGEPCGIEACMILVNHFLSADFKHNLLDDVVLLIVPVYNVGGMLNRSSFSRANQDGPEAYGFRGNARNLDLNRDFIKADSRNTLSLLKLFKRWSPDVFIDTHTSNGADYPYTMTLIANMNDRLAPPLGNFIYEDLLPGVYRDMEERRWPMIPYVNAPTTPDEGIVAFDDLARYSMGFGALHHIPSFTTEAHMLKPYRDRVESTYQFLDVMIKNVARNKKQLKRARHEAEIYYAEQNNIPLKWMLDKTKSKKLLFKGYTAKTKTSEVTGLERLYYDRSEPYEKEIPFWNHYNVSEEVEVPHTYVLPQAYSGVAERLRLNGVEIERSRRDSFITSRSYRISDFKTRSGAYESHYLHYNIEVEMEVTDFHVRSGDYVISTHQPARRFIIETLEPQAPDSYFAWNYFDEILMQKEYFSAYVFEDLAAELLRSDDALQAAFTKKKENDEDFAGNARAQLDFIYKSSHYYEKTHNLYPVARLFD